MDHEVLLLAQEPDDDYASYSLTIGTPIVRRCSLTTIADDRIFLDERRARRVQEKIRALARGERRLRGGVEHCNACVGEIRV